MAGDEQAPHVHAHRLVPLLDRALDEGRARRNHRVVHENVDAAERVDRSVGELLDVVGGSDVAADGDSTTTGVGDAVGRLLGRARETGVRGGRAARRAHDLGTRRRQADRERASDAPRRPRDDGDRARERPLAQASLVAGNDSMPPRSSSRTAGTGSGSANTSVSR